MKADSSSPESASEIIGGTDGAQLRRLARLIFGGTLEVANAQAVKLAFHRSGYWILRAGERPARGTSKTAAQKQNRFLALSREGLSLPFAEIFFSVFSGNTGGNDAAVVFQIGQRSDTEKQDVRALFSGDGAPPPPEGDLQVADSAGAAAAKGGPRTSNAPTTQAGGPDTPRTSAAGPRVLYALVRHDVRRFDDGGSEADDAWTGSISLGEGPGKETAVLELQPNSSNGYLAWCNPGDGNPVLALQIDMALAIRREIRATPSRFEHLNGRLWRARDETGRERFVASLTPTLRGMQVDTRFGQIMAAPLPKLPRRPGIPARVPAIQIGGVGPQSTRTLTHFEAPLVASVVQRRSPPTLEDL